jgi:hypothetical protein
VQDHEEDGGFFLTGINTGGHEQKADESIDIDNQEDEQVDKYSYDEADTYKHVAIVDFTNAFSTQEVSFK